VIREIFLLVLWLLTVAFGVLALYLYRKRAESTADDTAPSPRNQQLSSPLPVTDDSHHLLDEEPFSEPLESDPQSAKICPKCGTHYSFSSWTCPRDDTRLRALN
jgi:cytoskeletal protein RodZ